jgi:hypothetical protein
MKPGTSECPPMKLASDQLASQAQAPREASPNGIPIAFVPRDESPERAHPMHLQLPSQGS